jgi:hypothetical protein
MMQTLAVVLIIALAAAYVAWKYRPSRLKSENPCDSCASCAGSRDEPACPSGLDIEQCPLPEDREQ